MDGTYLIRRAYFACNQAIIKPEVTKKDEETGEITLVTKAVQDPNLIVVSVLQSISKLIREDDYDKRVIFCQDHGKWLFRPKTVYKDYKATRDHSSYLFDCCWKASDMIAEILNNKIGIINTSFKGVESDDQAYYYSHNSDKCTLVTSDADWLLAVTPSTRVKLLKQKKELGYGDLIDGVNIVEPFDLAIEKAIIGDQSDNIAAIPSNELPSGLSTYDIILRYKSRDLPEKLLGDITHTLGLTRLDHIMNAPQVMMSLDVQNEEFLEKPLIPPFETQIELARIDAPQYLNGVFGKYSRLHCK
jgi:hypothetical protein